MVADRLARIHLRLLQARRGRRHHGSSSEQQPGRASEKSSGALDRLGPARWPRRFSRRSAPAPTPAAVTASAGSLEATGTSSSSPPARRGASDTAYHEGGSLGSPWRMPRSSRGRGVNPATGCPARTGWCKLRFESGINDHGEFGLLRRHTDAFL